MTPSRPTSLAGEHDRLGPRGERLAAHRAQKLVLPVAGDAGDAENLARPDLERDVLQRDAEFARLRQAQALRRELGLAEAARGGLGDFLEIGADHHLGHRARGLPLRIAVGDDLAAAQDGRGVAERDDLVQLVRDVEDRAAARGELAQRLEQLLDLLRRQHRGRLVHDQEPGIEEQRAHDLDPLALADAERRDDAARIELELVGLEHPVELGEQFARRQARVEAEGDVFQHRHRLEQREVLEHHADAEAPRGAGIRDPDGRAVEDDLSLVGREDAVDHLDESRFSRAVLAEQGVDLARLDAEIDVVIGADAGKRLAHADELEPQGRFDIHRDRTSFPSSLFAGVASARASTQESRRGADAPALRGAVCAVGANRPRRRFFDRNDPARRVK